MKKMITILLALACCLMVTGCGRHRAMNELLDEPDLDTQATAEPKSNILEAVIDGSPRILELD